MTFISAIEFMLVSILICINVTYITCFINNAPYRKRLINYICIGCTGIFSLCYLPLSSNADNAVLKLVFLIIYYSLLFLCVCLSCKEVKLKIILYIFLFYLTMDSIFQSTFLLFVNIFYKNYDNLIALFISVITNLFVLMLFIKLSQISSARFHLNSIHTATYILILLALFFSGGLIENQLTATDDIIVQSSFNKIFTVISIVLLIFIIASLVFNCISKAYFENVSSILEKQVNAQVDYYKKVDRLNKDLRDFRHDYKNHMICIQGLLDSQEYDEAREYIHGITLRKTILSKEFASGNSIADALLSDKAECTEEIGAELQFKGVIFEDIPSVDLCTILSNALDNAIEACEKISSDEPKIISVKCSYIKHIQFILISNPVAEDVKIINNAVETSKADKNVHGIGLYNIRRTVAKYEGEFEISCKDKMFVMDIGFKVD